MGNLKIVLGQYRADIEGLVNIKSTQFDAGRISNMVLNTPERKYKAGEAMINSFLLEAQAKQQLNKEKSKRILEANTRDELGSAQERKAWADTHPDVEAAEIEYINAQAEHKAAQIAFQCLDDLFTAGKKISDRLAEQSKIDNQIDRYSTK